MSTVKELLQTTDRDAVLAALYRLYEGEESNHNGYCDAWAILLPMEPTLSELAWVDVEMTRHEDEDKPYPDVSGIRMGDDERWSCSTMPWSEWLYLEVRIKSPELMKVDALAAILYEITYHGYTPEDTESFLAELNAMAGDIDEILEHVEGMSDEEAKAYLEEKGLVSLEKITDDND